MKVSKQYKKTVKFFFDLGCNLSPLYGVHLTERFIDKLFTLTIMAKNFKSKTANGKLITAEQVATRKLRTLKNMMNIAKPLGIKIHVEAGDILFEIHGITIEPEEIL